MVGQGEAPGASGGRGRKEELGARSFILVAGGKVEVELNKQVWD